ncbi:MULTISPECIES: hypothetical protein [Heyndrickxia]|jgi:uncharacterized membrane protein YhaH (DUF805 family)|uniref:Uncharacterized protein n=1 Tax=Heyndrickxia faecalis TaxID=2824910 RepID=A0AAU7WID2_9BACI|nr:MULTISPECIES: hypothetical protein [Heyndrickxia]MEC2304035.1 hypothetical protein [Weizmannia sp. CD-2023]MEC2339437.1 hypothetical protein [Weizmannia sp. CD-2023]
MKILEKLSYWIFILCAAVIMIINFTSNNGTIKDVVGIICFVIVLIVALNAIIYRKKSKGK